MKKNIRIEGPAIAHVSQAIRDGYYVEAMQVLHGYLEWQLRLFFVASGLKTDHHPLAWDLSYEFPLHFACKALFILGKISKEEMDLIIRVNKTRNQLVHGLFRDPYDGEDRSLPRQLYDRTVKDAQDLVKTLDNRLSLEFGETKET